MTDLFTKVSQIKTRTKVLIVLPVLSFTLMLSINKAPLQREFTKRPSTEVTVPQATVPSPELSRTAPTSIVKSSPEVGQEVSSLQQQKAAKAPVPRAQPTPTPFVVLPGKSVGNFSLGMTKEEVLKIAPKPQENTPHCLVYRSKKTGNVLRAHFEKNHLVQIDFTSKDFSTEAGIHTGNFRDEQYTALFDVQALPGTSLGRKHTLKTGGLTFYSVSDPLSRALGVVHAGHEPLYDVQRIALETQEQVQGALPQRINGLLPEDIPNPYTGEEGHRNNPPLHSGSGVAGASSGYSASPGLPSPSLNSALPATGVSSLPRTSWQAEQARRDRERAGFLKQQGYNFDPSTTSAHMMDQKVNDIKRSTYWKEQGYSFDPNFMSAYAMDQKVKDIDRAHYWKERGHNFNPDYMSAYAMDQKVKDIERAKYWKERGLHFDPNFMTAYAMDSEAQRILRGSK